MKKALIISISFSAILLIAIIFLITSVRGSENNLAIPAKQSATDKKSCCAEEKSGKASESSIYQLESRWKTEAGDNILLSHLGGKKQIMAMVFTTCTYACPLILNDMKRIESQVNRNDVEFLLISIDPKRDTPFALKKYAEANKLDLKNWKLLTSDESSVSELAAVLGFKYKQEPDGSFSHSNIINVLNEKGEVSYQHFGLNQDVQDVLDNLNK